MSCAGIIALHLLDLFYWKRVQRACHLQKTVLYNFKMCGTFLRNTCLTYWHWQTIGYQSLAYHVKRIITFSTEGVEVKRRQNWERGNSTTQAAAYPKIVNNALLAVLWHWLRHTFWLRGAAPNSTELPFLSDGLTFLSKVNLQRYTAVWMIHVSLSAERQKKETLHIGLRTRIETRIAN